MGRMYLFAAHGGITELTARKSSALKRHASSVKHARGERSNPALHEHVPS